MLTPHSSTAIMNLEPGPTPIEVKEGSVVLVTVVTKLIELRESVSMIMLANPITTAMMMAMEIIPPVKERYYSSLLYRSI